MRRFLLFLLAVLIILYAIETTGVLGLGSFKPFLVVEKVDNEYVLSWSKVPYPVYYEIEVLSQPPGDVNQPADNHRIATFRTLSNQFTINNSFPYRIYWRVSAHSIFRHPLGEYSNTASLADIMGLTAQDFSQVKPKLQSQYPASNPASLTPMLTWSTVPGAVYYELEFTSQLPENPNDIALSAYSLYSTREVFTNGYNADLSWFKGTKLYWRVRALDYYGNPLGVFSDAGELFINRNLHTVLKPLINTQFNVNGAPTPLYPVYSWIPITGAVNYEVEVTSQPPENPNTTAPSAYRIWSKNTMGGFDCYDDEPRNTPGTYYWRVRGLDAFGNAVGVYSDTAKFVVDLSKGNYAATFGDSITHGGGAISYSPADLEYSYQTYLNFPAVNLGKSGDTSEAMAARFDRDVLPYHPKYLLILGGTNSLRGGVPASQVISELAEIRDKCIAAGIRPIFLTLPPINPDNIDRVFHEETAPNWQEEFETVNNFIRQQRYYIDLSPHFTDADGLLPEHYAIDGLHPDIEGKKLMAQIINAHWTRVIR